MIRLKRMLAFAAVGAVAPDVVAAELQLLLQDSLFPVATDLLVKVLEDLAVIWNNRYGGRKRLEYL